MVLTIQVKKDILILESMEVDFEKSDCISESHRYPEKGGGIFRDLENKMTVPSHPPNVKLSTWEQVLAEA